MTNRLLILLVSIWGLNAQEPIMPHGEPYFVPEIYLQAFPLPESLVYDEDKVTRALPQIDLDHGYPWFLNGQYDGLFTPFYDDNGTYIPLPIVRPHPTAVSTAEDLYWHLITTSTPNNEPDLKELLLEEESKAQPFNEKIKNQKALFMEHANFDISKQELQNIIDGIPLKGIKGKITKHEIANSLTRQFFDTSNITPSDLPQNYPCFSQLDAFVLTINVLYSNTPDTPIQPTSSSDYIEYCTSFMGGLGSPDIETFVLDVTKTPIGFTGKFGALYSAYKSQAFSFLKENSCEQLKANLFNRDIPSFIEIRPFMNKRTERNQSEKDSE
ncbi:hypothetical protein JW872_01500 [Candidatus Babeliales bacterium]|nr:hypothetical protein [Candidatus Babeliales bacterium]